MAHAMPRSERWERFVQRFLPWYDPLRERLRDAQTEAIHERSIRERISAERIIADYQQTERQRQDGDQ